VNGQSATLIKKKNAFETLVLPLIIAIGIPAVIYVEFLEPAFSSYRMYSQQAVSDEARLAGLKKQYGESSQKETKKSDEKPVIYLLNYLESITAKSNIKLKSFQEAGGAGAKGITAFQMRFACNADTFAKFLFMSENTVPPLAVSNWRVTSIAGGSYSGMRQLEGMATVTFVSSRAGKKTDFAKLDRYKGNWRDVFAEVQKEALKAAPPPEPEEKEAPEPDPVVKWTLTAQMSDGESDLVVITHSLTGQRVIADLKKINALINVKGEEVEITVGEEKVLWKLGSSLEQDKLPVKLKELILEAKDGVPAKTEESKPAESGAVKKAEPEEEAVTPDDNTAPAPRGGRQRGRRNRPAQE